MTKNLLQNQEFEQIVQNYLPLVYGLCFSYLKNEMDAEDMAQETFIKAWKHLSDYDDRWELGTWLGTIAKRTCLDYLKKKKIIPASHLSESEGLTFENQPSEMRSFAEDMDASISATWVNSFLSHLKQPYQEVLKLYYQQDLNFREIAQHLGLPINTVKSRHRRAINLLRDELAEN